jgi:putative membrane protein
MKKTTGMVFLVSAMLCLMAPKYGSSQASARLTDPEIASVAVVANQNDIDFANIALKKSSNADVKQFAQTMAADHKAVIDQAVALVTKLNVTPKDNSTSQSLKSNAAAAIEKLNAASGAAFDKAYIDNEVTYHQAVITEVESVLIPEAQNAELKALLQSVLPTLKTHLEHAQMVQGKVGK